MRTLQHAVATVFHIGHLGKGAGTVASMVYCAFWLLTPLGESERAQVLLLSLVFGLGTWSAQKAEKLWGKDSQRIVIDEVAGMIVALIFIPVGFVQAAAGLILFRFFDITKPLGIKRAESLPGGWGVMADDVLAGLYVQLVLRITYVNHL